MAVMTRRAVAGRPTAAENLCPGCGLVPGPRSFYCQTHIAELWQQVWMHRPDDRSSSASLN
jgi:hypothetical protein